MADDDPSDSPLSRQFLILYATETGNALDAAERIAREALRRHIRTSIHSVDSYTPQSLIDEPIVVFVLSTTGSGEEPRSMKTLWRSHLLRSDLPADLFDEMMFTVFGLGDSAYERFCWASKKLVRRLKGLGAHEFCESAHADEQERFGYETVLMPWMDTLFAALQTVLPPMPDGLDIIPSSTLMPPRARVSFLKDTGVPTTPLIPTELATTYYDAVLTQNRRITATGWTQDVRDIVLEFDERVQWSPGDIAVLHPHTHPDDVKTLLDRFGWTEIADTPLTCTPTETLLTSEPSSNSAEDHSTPSLLPSHITPSTVTTLRELFTTTLDISCVPRKSFFEWLIHFTSDPLEKEKFEEFTSLSEEGQDDLYQYTHRVRRTILEVLCDFRYVSIPLDYIFDVFPPIRARQFSIASSSRVAQDRGRGALDGSPNADAGASATRMELCVAIVQYRTKLKAPRRGLCTTWLSALKPTPRRAQTKGVNGGDDIEKDRGVEEGVTTQIRVGIRKGALRLPPSPPLPTSTTTTDAGEQRDETPVICVGPGTGIAPMRAIIQERVACGQHQNTLYFGCRSSMQDYYYATEWESLAQKGQLVFSVAFSRDQENKVYVQDLISGHSTRIWDLVDKHRAWVYISGSSNKMPAAVKAAIQAAAVSVGGLSEPDAEKYITRMEWEGRLYEECWS